MGRYGSRVCWAFAVEGGAAGFERLEVAGIGGREDEEGMLRDGSEEVARGRLQMYGLSTPIKTSGRILVAV